MYNRNFQSLKITLPALALAAWAATFPSFAQVKTITAHENGEAEVTYGANLQVMNPKLAKQNWILECQGCHRADASGKVGEIPDMNGQVSKMLLVSGGQEYLSRVNGIAEAPLSDDDLVDLMNWMLIEFDPDHIPETFSGFKAEDVGRLRRMPLDHTILDQRANLETAIAKLNSDK